MRNASLIDDLFQSSSSGTGAWTESGSERERLSSNWIAPGSASTIIVEGPGNPNRGPAVKIQGQGGTVGTEEAVAHLRVSVAGMMILVLGLGLVLASLLFP